MTITKETLCGSRAERRRQQRTDRGSSRRRGGGGGDGEQSLWRVLLVVGCVVFAGVWVVYAGLYAVVSVCTMISVAPAIYFISF